MMEDSKLIIGAEKQPKHMDMEYMVQNYGVIYSISREYCFKIYGRYGVIIFNADNSVEISGDEASEGWKQIQKSEKEKNR